MNPSPLRTLRGRDIAVRVTDELSIDVIDGDDAVIWSSSRQHLPRVTLANGQVFSLHDAEARDVSDFTEAGFVGHRVNLVKFGDADVEIDLVLALDDTDTLLVQIEQSGGKDAVRQIDHLYRIEKPTSQGGYMVLPHGSGYLIHADCADELPGERDDTDLIGTRWTLPMFGMVRDDHAMCVIVEDWWDCEVKVEHRPGRFSALEFNWWPSLGRLAYRRRMLVQFARDMDHVGMAKAYRAYARTQGLVRTLEEKAEQTPILRRYFDSILVRWHTGREKDRDRVMADLRRFREMGFNLIFFYPKWASKGYSAETADTATDPSRGTWHSFLQPNPGRGGWPVLVQLAEEARSLDCVIHVFTRMISHDEGAPDFNTARLPRGEDGELTPVSRGASIYITHDEHERLVKTLDFIEERGLKLDTLYFDGYAAHAGGVEDYSPEHPVTRRRGYDLMNEAMAETRARGIMPAAEVGRFWCVPDTDFFFFTDWSRERLTNTDNEQSVAPVGDPVPLFQLVFHDCCMAGFSGGGYSNIRAGCDWWRDRTPRLYEMLFASAPAYNWLPTCDLPVEDWDSDVARAKFEWLKRWSTYYRAIATAEMTSHRFLSDDRKQQRIEFDNGIWAEFDMGRDMCRVGGIEGFSGDWETPAGDLGPYVTS